MVSETWSLTVLDSLVVAPLLLLLLLLWPIEAVSVLILWQLANIWP